MSLRPLKPPGKIASRLNISTVSLAVFFGRMRQMQLLQQVFGGIVDVLGTFPEDIVDNHVRRRIERLYSRLPFVVAEDSSGDVIGDTISS
jgi:hypothetical protein